VNLWITVLVVIYLFCVNAILDASFSENFYGLRRVACKHPMPGESASNAGDGGTDTQIDQDEVRHLTTSDRRRSLLFLVSMLLVITMLCSPCQRQRL